MAMVMMMVSIRLACTGTGVLSLLLVFAGICPLEYTRAKRASRLVDSLTRTDCDWRMWNTTYRLGQPDLDCACHAPRTRR